MDTDRALPEKVRHAIDSGKLPKQKPDRVLGGLGTGKPCAVCGGLLTPTQMEMELEFHRRGPAPGPDRYWTHPRCFAAWELEMRDQPGGGAVGGNEEPARYALPTWSPDAPLDRNARRP
jgi:hypothetical protein